MDSLSNLVGVMMTITMLWAGGYAIYSVIRLQRDYILFDNSIIYPAQCKPRDCKDVGGFIAFMAPRLWIFGILCAVIGLVMLLSQALRVLVLPDWGDYALLGAGLAVIVWYMVVINRASKKFW